MDDKDKLIQELQQKEFYLLLMEVLKTTEYVTTKMMLKQSDIPESTTRRYLTKFCEMKIIKSDGKNKGTKYYLV